MTPNMSVVNLLCLLFVCALRSWTQAEVFTAISDCEPLLATHGKIIHDLDYYIQQEEERVQILRSHISMYKKEHEKAMEDIPNYLGNPINAFTLIKRLTKDLEKIDKGVNIGIDYIRNLTLSRSDVDYPTLEDLVGAANALTRLQTTYKLEVNDLAEGLLNGVAYSSSMSADDCFELGRTLMVDQDYKNSIAWMTEALRKYNEEKNSAYSFTEVDIMDHISWSYYNLGDLHNALEWTEKWLVADPNHGRARANLEIFKQRLAEQPETYRQTAPRSKKTQYCDDQLYNTYDALCRGDYEISHNLSKRLTCFYLTDNPFLRLAPIKTEQKYADPDVYVFYDVISDDEIAHVKYLAQPKLKRAVVHDSVTGKPIKADYRISKSSWIDDKESPIIFRISQRVADFTGLNMETAELLQVANYGIGGHYEPHLDFALKSEESFKATFNGNRIATVLFYISEVAEGGATVFTELGLSVFPVKNAALFWLNLHPSGEGDISTRHAACPVLRGSKWVANKWIHLGGQEMVKKTQCNLEYQPEEWIREVPQSVLKSHR